MVSIVGRSVVAVVPAVVSIAVQAVGVPAVVSVSVVALAVAAVPPDASPALVYAFET